MPETLPLFCGASAMGPVPLAVTDPATIGPEIVLVQSNVVPPIVAVGMKFKDSVLHICCDKLGGLLVMTGTGFIVTNTSNVGPGQLLAEGVIVYVTVPLLDPSVLVSNCEIMLPAPAEAPVVFVPDTVHVYVVPETKLGLVILMLVDWPLQII